LTDTIKPAAGTQGVPAGVHQAAIDKVQCPNCCRMAAVTERRMGLLFFQCELCETVGATPDPAA
jgi:ribosomal protein L37AE/L43A